MKQFRLLASFALSIASTWPFSAHASIQAISCWKLKGEEGGTITILHENHAQWKSYKKQFNAFTSTLDEFSEYYPDQNLHAIIENVFSCENGDIMKEILQFTRAPEFLSLCAKLFEDDHWKTKKNIFFTTSEFRNNFNIISNALALCTTCKRNEKIFEKRDENKKLRALLNRCIQATVAICLKDIYEEEYAKLNRYIRQSISSYEPIFREFQKNITERMDRIKKKFTDLGIDEEEKIILLYLSPPSSEEETKKRIALYDIIFSPDWLLMLDEMIEVNTLWKLFSLKDNEHAVVVTGFAHAQNIEFVLKYIKASCTYSKSYSTPDDFPLSEYKKILPEERRAQKPKSFFQKIGRFFKKKPKNLSDSSNYEIPMRFFNDNTFERSAFEKS